MRNFSNVLQSSSFARIKFFNCVSSRQIKAQTLLLSFEPLVPIFSSLFKTLLTPFSFNFSGGDFLGCFYGHASVR